MKQVTVQPSGTRFNVRDDETILDAAIREDVMLPYGCRVGLCGSCKSRLLNGEIHYEDPDLFVLTDEEKQDGYILVCQAKPTTDVEIEGRLLETAADIEVRTLPARVERMETLCHDVIGLWLQLPKSERLQFLAGQYLEILLRNGSSRSFSMANAPEDDALMELHVRHVPGGLFTDHVFNKMKPRDMLKIRGPLGSFFLREENDQPVILVAGGTGFAPIKSIVEHLIDRGSERELHLFWGARAREDLYMHDLAMSWQNALPHFTYTPVLSEPGDNDQWKGETGWVHEAVVTTYADLSAYQVYASGPPPMIKAAQDLFPDHKLNPELFYFDSFEYSGN